MRVMLHTFAKDLRRLWPAIAALTLLFGLLVREERWRGDQMVLPTEAWLNILVSGAWACLAALAVLEEPLVGDRHFWMTRPHPRHWLLLAKLAFALITLHLPLFLADVYVLSARGFSPAAHLDDLLLRQALFLAALTLPALGVAALVRSFTHFVIALFVVGALLVALDGQRYGYQLVSPWRESLVRWLLGGGAVIVLVGQYLKRRVATARAVGIVAALAAALVSAYLPLRAEYAVAQGPRLTLRALNREELPHHAPSGGASHTVMLPIRIETGTQRDPYHVAFAEAEIVAADGSVLRSLLPQRTTPSDRIEFMAHTFSTTQGEPPDWLRLQLSAAAWNRVKNGRARVRGEVALEFHRPLPLTTWQAQASGAVEGVGRCEGRVVDDRIFSEPLYKVLCESPSPLPRGTVVLRHPASGREWRAELGSFYGGFGMSYVPGAQRAWFSPLHRTQAFFRLNTHPHPAPGSDWMVPVEMLSSARVEITPRVHAGRTLVHFDFAGVDLATWLIPR
jgi:hypothetical protein